MSVEVQGRLYIQSVGYDYLPIEWAQDGAVAPDAAAEIADGTGAVMARDFGGAAGATVQDVVYAWEVPDNIDVSKGIKFKVFTVITDGAGPSAEGISFKLSGYSVGDNDPIDGAFGTEIEANKTGQTAIQYDRLEVAYSGVVTVTNLAAGELAMLHFERDTADGNDTYEKPIGVTGIMIKYYGLTGIF